MQNLTEFVRMKIFLAEILRQNSSKKVMWMKRLHRAHKVRKKRKWMAGLTGAALLSSVMMTGMPSGKAQPFSDKAFEAEKAAGIGEKYKEYITNKIKELYEEKLAEKTEEIKREILQNVFQLIQPETKHASANKVLQARATAYASGPEDNGIWNDKTHIGTKVRPGIIAVDPNVIPLGSKVYIEFEDGEGMYAVAEDTGGAIKGNRIDIAMSTRDKAKKFGIQEVKVHVLEKVLNV